MPRSIILGEYQEIQVPNIAAVLKAEISRLARKEVKSQITPLKKTVAEQRRIIAGLRHQVAALERGHRFLQKQERSRLREAPEAAGATDIRFSPKWVAADRERLELSAKDYGLLVGVSMLTIYNWEKGKSKPQAKALAGWAKVRGIGKREAWKRLELLEG